MNQVHFASMEDEEDDMYAGFNDLTATDITQVSHDGGDDDDDDGDRMIAQSFVLSATTPLLNIAVHSGRMQGGQATGVLADQRLHDSPQVTILYSLRRAHRPSSVLKIVENKIVENLWVIWALPEPC